ncbi:hypothetical protein ACM01_00015 [Streptomyces viridochromogenes]|uniref:DUF5133 domain-containing protein n=1 Tax=Streptomyces viridochromogenes TaxID=1938 RepID=A0A0J7ZM41_STRVR|nr:DUF5133 domain-containing protein [Streptomyces viridochromogenes]KMS77076.1 hypothetical protein ACM01_00015 [Streptomyces viridochromogenes]
MLMPHPTMLRRLVEEYETLMSHPGGGDMEGSDDGTGQRVLRAQDLAYTLCVSTGTREVGRALEAARRLLAAAHDPVAARYLAPPHDSAVPG